MGIEITPRPRPPWSRSPPRSGPAPSSSRSCQARGRIIYSRLRAPGSNLELNLARKIFSRVPSIGLGWRGKTGSRVTMWAGFIIMHHRGSSQSPATSQKLFIPGPPLVFAGHRETLLYYQRRLSKTVKVYVVLASLGVLHRRTKVGSLLVSCRWAAAAPLYCEAVMLGITSKTGISYPWHNTRLSLGHSNADFNTIYTCKSRKNGLWTNFNYDLGKCYNNELEESGMVEAAGLEPSWSGG